MSKSTKEARQPEGCAPMTGSARRYRVVRASNIWSDAESFFPESRPKWWPFWFRFDDGTGCQISFRRADAAKRFIEVARWEDRDELTKLREWILAAAPVMESAICIAIEERPDRIGEIPGCQAIMETCPLEWEPMPHLRQNDSDELTRRGEK